jgi:hypothetical protein
MSANKLNLLRCGNAGGGNLGVGDCDIEKGPVIGNIAIPRGFKFSLADTASESAFEAALAAGSVNDSYASRMFGILEYVGITDTGEAPKIETLPNGVKRRTFDSVYGYEYLMVAGAYYHKALKSTIDGKHLSFDLLEVTKQGDGTYAVWGTNKSDTSNNNVMGGRRPSQINVGRLMGNDYTKGQQFTVGIGFQDNNEIEKNWAVMILENNPLDLMVGLMSVQLILTSSSATVIHMKAITSWGKDLLDDFSTAIAQVGLISVKNRDIGNSHYGNAITVSAIAADATGWAITIAATGTDPDNPGSGKQVGVSWVAPSVAEALSTPVVGFEATEQLVTLG